jgi:RimJ/RimL family protein N-acetyltransferase
MSIPLLPATWPIPLQTETLTGNLVRLETLTAEHIPELVRAGSDPSVWQFTTSRGDSPSDMHSYVSKLLHDWKAGSAMPLTVREVSSGAVVGCTRLKELDRNHRHAILGSWYSPQAWQTGVNLEAKLLLLDYAFEKLGCVRIEFHTDSRNRRSRTSLEKLGATSEGVLRAHQITRDGSLRDSAIYSILASEWPGVRSAIVERLMRHAPAS